MASEKQSNEKRHLRAPTPSMARPAVTAKSLAKSTSRPATKRAAPPSAQAPREASTASLDRALDLLEVLAKGGPVTLDQLAEASGSAPVTAIRLLRVLQTRGFAVSDPSQKLWRLGVRWSALGKAATQQGALAVTAMPFLAALGAAAGENAYLRVRDGMASETVAVHQTDPALRIYTEAGSRGPLHAGISRLLLAYAPESVQTQVLTQRLPRFTPATRTDATWIAADLQRIRTRGYLVTADEVVAGAVSVAAPVRDASGQVIAAIFVGAPTMRMRPPRPRALVTIVQDAAAKLSQALGYVRTEPTPISAPARRTPATPGWPVPNGVAASSTSGLLFR